MTTGILHDFPEGIEKIVRDVRKEMKEGARFGPGEDQEEDGAREILNRIRSKDFPKGLGLDRNEYQSIDSMRSLSVCDWAAKEYFKLLLADLRRYPEFFLNHRSCIPEDC
jgi:hypothetical protein